MDTDLPGQITSSIKGCTLCVLKVECNCLISSESFVILPHLHSCLTNNEMVISNKSNIPLLLHAPALINELFNTSRSDILARRMGDKLTSFQVLGIQFSQRVANDKPK
jgi:hypothetical protein